MRAFTDWRCEKCKRKFATVNDTRIVECPHCDHEMDVGEWLDRLQELREEALEEPDFEDLRPGKDGWKGQ